MAGMGKRMRPHTLNIPKPLLKIAGKSIVHRIVEDLKSSSGKPIDNIHFVIGNFGSEVENSLLDIASGIGAKGHIHYQEEALGTAHAVYCAKDALEGEVLIAFADTLFIGDFNISDDDECIIWTMKVANPEQYGVVITDENNCIKNFLEKPKDFISDKAIIGIYYFREGNLLREDIKRLIDNNIVKSGEYQLTDNLRQLFENGVSFKSQEIDEWLDCGNKDEFLKSNKRILELKKFTKGNFVISNSQIDENVFIGENVEIINSKIGPYVSIERNCKIFDAEISETIISNDTIIKNCKFLKSMIGNNCKILNLQGKINIGDYSEYEGN